MTPSDFRTPSLIVTGAGAADRTPEVVERLEMRRVVVVTDRNIGSVAQGVVGSLESSGHLASVYDGVVTEPTTVHVEEILTELRNSDADGFVAVGGGSPIDAAKAAAAMARHEDPIETYMGYDRFQSAPLPLIAIPTTGGTGSEATRVVVITDTDRQIKMMMMADQLMATAAIVDPLLTVSCPPSVTASAGVDALSHAIEAYVSQKAQPMTDVLALSAAAAVAGALRTAFADGQNLEARYRVALGALQAGMAFSNSSVALVHGMSRPLGAVFGVPHGIANAMLLPAVMRFSASGAVSRYGDLGEAMGVSSSYGSDEARAEAAIVEVESLISDLGIPTLGGYGLERQRFLSVLEKMAEDALESGSPANNPVVPTRDQIVSLYESCY